MTEPWGLTGPQFLLLYLAGVAVTLLPVLLARRAARHAPAATDRPNLDTDQLALLAGGPIRLAETAIARLVAAGAVIATRGRLTASGTAPPDRPIERQLLREISHHPMSVRDALLSARRSRRVCAVADSLARQGLLVSRRKDRLIALLAPTGIYAVFAVGVVRAVHGANQDLTIDYLVLLLILTVLLVVALGTALRLKPRTVHGDALLRVRRSELAGSTETDVVVALGGLPAYPDAGVRRSLMSTGSGSISAYTTASWTYVSGSLIDATSSSARGGDE
jgi:uncharacterized protein (TIGR04222 family)